ncbi:MAG: hypothetical protein WAV56_02400, partial [Microgenomates group bacterium]
YWYVKNFVLFYNPIFPFVFPCKAGLVEACGAGKAGFFEGWMEPITSQTIRRIFYEDLFVKQRNLVYLFVANLILLIFQKSKKIKLASAFIFLAVVAELFILKKFSGFFIRYHQLIQIALMISLVLQVVRPIPRHPLRLKSWSIWIIFSLVLFFFIGRNAYRLIKSTYTPNYLRIYEVKYALGIMDIRDWISFKLPKMSEVIFFCEQPPENKDFVLSRLDPDLIWFTYEGQMRTFMTNCSLGGPSISGTPVEKALDYSIKKQLKYHLVSLNPCTPPDKLEYRNNERDYQRELRRLNNEVVCHSREVYPYIYLFDWQNIKK